MPSDLLRVERLSAAYGGARILFDLDFAVGEGEVVALLGRNGAGKSTTLKSVMGLVPQRSGEIAFAGAGIGALAPHRIARLGIGYVPEDRRIFTELTVLQNLEIGRQKARPGVPDWTPDMLFRLFPNLGEMRDRPGGRMSGGEQQMLTIARTLMGNPALVLLDEPSEGLAPRIVEEMAAAIRSLKSRGLTVLVSEQNLRFAALVADRGIVIETGHIRHVGAIAALVADAELQKRYLSA